MLVIKPSHGALRATPVARAPSNRAAPCARAVGDDDDSLLSALCIIALAHACAGRV